MASKAKQLPLPPATFYVMLPSKVWQQVEELPTEGRVRVERKKRPSKQK